MEREERRVYYDPELEIETYYFKGIVQKFPTHFHEHYVIGAIESGQRFAICGGEQYLIQPGDLVIFNPRQPHACEQVGAYPLDWRCVNVTEPVMERVTESITGRAYLPVFSKCVFYQSELAGLVREIYEMVAGEEREFCKEERFLMLVEQLLEENGGGFPPEPDAEDRQEIRAVCEYLEEHYGEAVSLDALAGVAGLSKCYLLRSFTRQKGISPYRYLETVRVDRAKRLLEQGVRPVDVALRTGFSDQSHFTNFFKNLIGLTPRQYQACFTGCPPRE